MRQTTVLADGLGFGEGPRWHEGKLWFSDMRSKQVMTLDLDGRHEPVVEVAGQPSGLGWLPDGRLLVVSMHDQRLLRLESSGELVEHADLSEIAGGHCNDMVVDQAGRAYVGNFGFDPVAYTGKRLMAPQVRENPDRFLNDPQLPTATLARVDPDGSIFAAADGLRTPNGSVITADGRTLIVAESLGPGLTAFDIAPDGTLANRRAWVAFSKQSPTTVPDGICLDSENGIWVSNPLSNECIRVAEGGEVLDRVTASGEIYACMLGGPERKTLFLIVNELGENPRCTIETVEVDVPGAGWP